MKRNVKLLLICLFLVAVGVYFISCGGSDTSRKATTWYIDADGDGYPACNGTLDAYTTVSASGRPAGGFTAAEMAAKAAGIDPLTMAASATTCDCNDASAAEQPGQTWYTDADGDGFPLCTAGDAAFVTTVQCSRPTGGVTAQEEAAITGGIDPSTATASSTTCDCNDDPTATPPGGDFFPGNPGGDLCIDGLTYDTDCDGSKAGASCGSGCPLLTCEVDPSTHQVTYCDGGKTMSTGVGNSLVSACADTLKKDGNYDSLTCGACPAK